MYCVVVVLLYKTWEDAKVMGGKMLVINTDTGGNHLCFSDNIHISVYSAGFSVLYFYFSTKVSIRDAY